jgi:hypothetical protein
MENFDFKRVGEHGYVGPAFETLPEQPLTKRERFAAMAMAGALGGVPGSHLLPDQLARDSVGHADALIAALAKVAP